MSQKEIIKMSKKEKRRIKVINRAIKRDIKQKQAARELCISVRHTRRLIRKVKKSGDRAIIHGNRGKPSNRRYSDEFREKAIAKIEQDYDDFGPTLAMEKLEENHGIRISKETARQWMIGAGIWTAESRKEKDSPESWRERKAHEGELVQTDGSIGYWFEDRGPKAVMMAYIDDATNRLFARFYPSENTEAAMESFRRYIEKHGIPKALYFDRNSIYNQKTYN